MGDPAIGVGPLPEPPDGPPVHGQTPQVNDRPPEDPTPPPPSRPSRRTLNPFVELVVILAVAFGLAYVAQGWLVKPYRIPSASMEPTLQSGDRVLVNRFIYRFHPPHRGDVIVFHPPGRGSQPIRGARTQASVYFIKRLIGLPGETIQVTIHRVLVCRAPHAG
ncbi:MAG: signal peptidase I, partial [Gaiellales bacterium]